MDASSEKSRNPIVSEVDVDGWIYVEDILNRLGSKKQHYDMHTKTWNK
jgi:hypothetical protein